MFKLISLELRQNRLKPYLLATVGVCAVLLGLSYLFAALPLLPTDNELEAKVMEVVGGIFGTYENIIALVSILSMFCFGVLSTVMLSKFVIADYTGKRANLLFAYPYDRRQMFAAKVIVVSLFTVIAMFLCNGVMFAVFFTTESIHPLVQTGMVDRALIVNALQITLVFSMLSVAIGLLSLCFAFRKKSVAAMMVPAYILAAVFSNIFGSAMLFGGSLSQSSLHVISAVCALALGVFFTTQVMRKVNEMEAV